MFNYSTCTGSGSMDSCPDGTCDDLEQLDKSLCPQDCVDTRDIRMSLLVNTRGSSQGIKSVKADNMTCTCDITSCQCFHSEYQTNSREDGEEDELFLLESSINQGNYL